MALEFRIKSHLTWKGKGRGQGSRLPRGEEIMFMKDEWPSVEYMGGVIFCNQVCLDVVLTSHLFSCDQSHSVLMKLRGRGFMTLEFLLEDLRLEDFT